MNKSELEQVALNKFPYGEKSKKYYYLYTWIAREKKKNQSPSFFAHHPLPIQVYRSHLLAANDLSLGVNARQDT